MRGAPALTTPDATPNDLPDEEALAAFVGPFWNRYYRAAFAKPRYNIVAALVPFWLSWRGLFGAQLLAMLAYPVLWVMTLVQLDRLTNVTLHISLTFGLPFAILGALEGAVADPLLRQKANRAWTRIRRRNLDRDATLAAMRQVGGVSVVNAIVMPIIGAAGMFVFLAVPGGNHSHSKAYIASMKSDLRNLVTAQESYFADNVTYTTSLDTTYYRSYTGVTVSISVATATGWNATARHNGAPDRVCGVFVGTAPPPVRNGQEGEPKCEEHRH